MDKLELQFLRETLMNHLPWSPMDFIPGISLEGDRRLFADTLTREIPEENDLRFIYRENGTAISVFCERLPWDSQFFGYNVAKLSGIFPLDPPEYRFDLNYSTAIEALLELAKKHSIRYLFAAVDPRDLSTLRALGEAGFSLIETRVYYHRDITDHTYKERFPVREATPEDIFSLGKAAQVMVNPYDRFHSDPFIQREDADRLMFKWVEASILEGFADATIVPDSINPTAFCTVKFHRDKWDIWGRKVFQVILTAVSLDFKGWFRKILSEVHYYARERVGAEHALYGTQLTNRAVIWVLESLGYKLGNGQYIFRIVI